MSYKIRRCILCNKEFTGHYPGYCGSVCRNEAARIYVRHGSTGNRTKFVSGRVIRNSRKD